MSSLNLATKIYKTIFKICHNYQLRKCLKLTQNIECSRCCRNRTQIKSVLVTQQALLVRHYQAVGVWSSLFISQVTEEVDSCKSWMSNLVENNRTNTWPNLANYILDFISRDFYIDQSKNVQVHTSLVGIFAGSKSLVLLVYLIYTLLEECKPGAWFKLDLSSHATDCTRSVVNGMC